VKPLDVWALAETLLRKAKRFLKHDGHVAAVAFIVHAGGFSTVGLQFKDAEQKRQAYVVVSDICRKLKADAVILINEVWFVDVQPSPGESADEITEELPPSEDPRRREAITMTTFGPGFKPTLTILPFRRKGKKVRFEERVSQSEYTEVEVRMIPKWWTDVPVVKQ